MIYFHQKDLEIKGDNVVKINDYKKVFLLILFCLFTIGFAHADSKESKLDQSGQAQNLLTEAVPELKGPKRTVSVGKFDAIGSFVQKYGNWDIGGGVSAMLVTALKESGRFIVMERANLSQVLNEQEMKAQGVTHGESGPSLGKVIGVNFLIYGSITEFGTDDEGGGMSLGFSGGSLGNLFSSGVSKQSSKGKLTMDLRIVDSTTSEIIETYKVSESVDSSGWDLNLGYKQINFGTNSFVKTPIGQAVRQAINESVQLIAKKANTVPWSAQIVDYDNGELYINAGADTGVQIGDQFIIERIVKRFTDPGTGKVIGIRKKEIGGLQLTGVEKKMSYGSFIPNGDEPPRRGDLVIQLN